MSGPRVLAFHFLSKGLSFKGEPSLGDCPTHFSVYQYTYHFFEFLKSKKMRNKTAVGSSYLVRTVRYGCATSKPTGKFTSNRKLTFQANFDANGVSNWFEGRGIQMSRQESAHGTKDEFCQLKLLSLHPATDSTNVMTEYDAHHET